MLLIPLFLIILLPEIRSFSYVFEEILNYCNKLGIFIVPNTSPNIVAVEIQFPNNATHLLFFCQTKCQDLI